jgi:hypothetical protein
MIVFNFGLTGDGYRQLNECSRQLSVDLLRPLCRCRTRCVEEQRPVDRALTRYPTESQESDNDGESDSGRTDRPRRQTRALKQLNVAGDRTQKTLLFLAVRNRKFSELVRGATVANGLAAIHTAF